MGYSTTLFFNLAGRILLAGVLCGILGFEREIKNKGAGLRTHVLVGLGAALIMVVSQYGYDAVLRTGVVLDPSRTAAQVVSGIGFLGAGLIFVKRDIVRGLTTAAGVWLSAAIGLAAGSGLVLLTAYTGFLALILIYTLGLLERNIIHAHKSLVTMTLVCNHQAGVIAQVSRMIADAGFKIENLILNRKSMSPDIFAMELSLSGNGAVQELFMNLDQCEAVKEIANFESICRGEESADAK